MSAVVIVLIDGNGIIFIHNLILFPETFCTCLSKAVLLISFVNPEEEESLDRMRCMMAYILEIQIFHTKRKLSKEFHQVVLKL